MALATGRLDAQNRYTAYRDGAHMRVRNDVTSSELRAGGAVVRGIERVRGVDAPFGRAHVRFELRRPVAIEIERAGGVERVAIRIHRGVPFAAFAAAPAAAIIISRIVRGKGRT